MIDGTIVKLGAGGGGGGGAADPFRVAVPSVDVDWDGFAVDGHETGEETRFIIVPLNTNRVDDIRRIKLNDPFDDDERNLRPNFPYGHPVNPDITLHWEAGNTLDLLFAKERVANGTNINARTATWPLDFTVNPLQPAVTFKIFARGQVDNVKGEKAVDNIHGRVVNVDLDVEADGQPGITDDDEPFEENPGGYACVCTNRLTPIKLTLAPKPGLPGKLTLSATMGGHRIRVWRDAGRTIEVPLTTGVVWNAGAAIPGTLYVEGIANSAAARDVELRLEYDENPAGQSNPLFMCADVVRLTVIKVDIDEFTDDEPYARHTDCPVDNHMTACQGTIEPVGVSTITYSIQSDAHGAVIDPDTGVITPGVGESGEITVRAAATVLPACYDDEQLVIHACPTGRDSHEVNWINENAVDPVTGKPSPLRVYGGHFKHIFATSGGSLEGESISEEIRIKAGENDFGLADCERDPGDTIWTLDDAGKMTEDDTYIVGYLGIFAGDFWPDDLPAHSVVEQKYFWRCPDCTAAGGADAWREVSGPYDIEFELKKGSIIDPAEIKVRCMAYGETKIHWYVGIVVLENLVMTPDTITANGTDTSQGSVHIIPSYRNVVWSISGAALGCTINAAGKVTAGLDDGTITVNADGEDAYSGVFSAETSDLTLTEP